MLRQGLHQVTPYAHNIILYHRMIYQTMLCYVILGWAALYFLYCRPIVLYILYCIVLQCTILCCTVPPKKNNTLPPTLVPLPYASPTSSYSPPLTLGQDRNMTKLYLKIAKTVQALLSYRHLAKSLETTLWILHRPATSSDYIVSKRPDGTAL